jgi:hypothetical protein
MSYCFNCRHWGEKSDWQSGRSLRLCRKRDVYEDGKGSCEGFTHKHREVDAIIRDLNGGQ